MIAAERKVIRCMGCMLNQFDTLRCRRCKRLLHKEDWTPTVTWVPGRTGRQKKTARATVAGRASERARALRNVRGLSQIELGKRMGMGHRTFVSKYEGGILDLTGPKMLRIAAALDAPPEFFIEEDEVTAWAALAVRDPCFRKEVAAVIGAPLTDGMREAG